MDVKGGLAYPVFHNTDHFKLFTDVLGLPYTGGDKVIIMGEKLARQFDLEIGDTIGNDWDRAFSYSDISILMDRAFGFKDQLTLADTYEKSKYGVPGAYTSFRLDSDFAPVDASKPNAILLLREACDDNQIARKRADLGKIIDEIKQRFPDLIIIDHNYASNYMNDTYASFFPFFWAIIAVIGATLALTTVGIFSVALEKREFEYSVFNAIGFSAPRVLLKGIAEVLILTIMSTVIGIITVLITVASINELILFERGQELYYYSDMAVISYTVCQVMITVMLVVMQVRKILKSNVVGY